MVDFKSILQSQTEYFLVLKPNSPNYTVLEICDGLLEAMEGGRENVVGKSVWQLYTQKKENQLQSDGQSLLLSLNNTLTQKKSFKVEDLLLEWPLVKNTFSFRCSSWSVYNKPVLDGKGDVRYIFQSFTCIEGTNPSPHASALKKAKGGERAAELDLLFKTLPQLLWVADQTGELRFDYEKYYDFAEDENKAIGKDCWKNFLHPWDLPGTEKAWAAARRDSVVFEMEHRIRMKDGTFQWHFSKAIPQKDSKGVLQWYGMLTNIHARKTSEEALQRSEEQLRLAMEAAELGSFDYYPQKNELFWSKKTREIIGFPLDAPASMEKYWEVVHPEERDRTSKLIQDAVSPGKGGEYENEFRIIRNTDKKIRWMRSKGKVFFDDKGHVIRFLGITQDITDQKEAEETHALTISKLTRINDDLDNFVYTASHDLKSPINHLEGLLNILLMEIPNDVLEKGEVQKTSQLMHQALERLKRNISSLAEVVKLRNDETEVAEKLAIQGVVEEVLIDLEPMIVDSGTQVEVKLEGCPRVIFLEKNLRSLVYNLLSNGIKYRSSRREPKIEISWDMHAKYCILIFKDNGVGIGKENVGQLFTLFKRFHPQVEGTGIGLYMVRRMVENAGGHVEVKSEEGKGSSFRVYLLAE